MNSKQAHEVLSTVLCHNGDIYEHVHDSDQAAEHLLAWLNKDEPEHHDLEYLLSVCLDQDLDVWQCSYCNERKFRFLGPDCPPGLMDEWPVTMEPVGGVEACEDCVKSADRLLSEVFASHRIVLGIS
jgi:hypothetical protein